jgi:hypothetical protein
MGWRPDQNDDEDDVVHHSEADSDELDLLRSRYGDDETPDPSEYDRIVNLAHEPLVRVSEVFVTADPQYTYNERKSFELEKSVRDYLEEKDQLLLITGPTKIGKTVLVDHVVPTETNSWVKVEGPTVKSVADVWKQVVDDLGLFLVEGTEASRKEGERSSTGTSAGVDLKIVKAGVTTGSDGTVETSAAKSRSTSP